MAVCPHKKRKEKTRVLLSAPLDTAKILLKRSAPDRFRGGVDSNGTSQAYLLQFMALVPFHQLDIGWLLSSTPLRHTHTHTDTLDSGLQRTPCSEANVQNNHRLLGHVVRKVSYPVLHLTYCSWVAHKGVFNLFYFLFHLHFIFSCQPPHNITRESVK